MVMIIDVFFDIDVLLKVVFNVLGWMCVCVIGFNVDVVWVVVIEEMVF